MSKTILSTHRTSLHFIILSAAAAASVALAGCGSAGNDAAAPMPSTTAPGSIAASGQALVISETWAKAADSGMTAAFGTIENTTDQDINIVGASTPKATTTELHEVVSGSDGGMKMQPKEGGFTVPAHGQITLEPGADHIMLMGLSAPVQSGDNIPFTLELSTGQSVDFTAVGKDFSGANENYGDLEHGDMDHDASTDAK